MRIIVAVACSLLIFAGMVFWMTPTKEPVGYCRVRFGVGDGNEFLVGYSDDDLLIYRTGDPNGTPERYPLSHVINSIKSLVIDPIQMGSTSYQITSVAAYNETEPSPRHSLMMSVTITEDGKTFKQYCDVELQARWEESKLAHFDGPLEAQVRSFDFEVITPNFVVDAEAVDLRVQVGTFNKADGVWTVVETGADGVANFDDGVCPTATIEFPSSDPDRPIVVSYPLDQFC